MSDKRHTIRLHQPRLIPKQWVVGPLHALRFTEYPTSAGRYLPSEVDTITEQLAKDYPNAVVAKDAL